MISRLPIFALLVSAMMALPASGATPTFLEDAKGKRLVQINEDEVGLADSGKTAIYIRGKDLLKNIHDPAFMVVDDKTVWTDASQASLKIAVFDEGTIRHGPRSTGKARLLLQAPGDPAELSGRSHLLRQRPGADEPAAGGGAVPGQSRELQAHRKRNRSSEKRNGGKRRRGGEGGRRPIIWRASGWPSAAVARSPKSATAS